MNKVSMIKNRKSATEYLREAKMDDADVISAWYIVGYGYGRYGFEEMNYDSNDFIEHADGFAYEMSYQEGIQDGRGDAR